jgi:hypothetical protein
MPNRSMLPRVEDAPVDGCGRLRRRLAETGSAALRFARHARAPPGRSFAPLPAYFEPAAVPRCGPLARWHAPRRIAENAQPRGGAMIAHCEQSPRPDSKVRTSRKRKDFGRQDPDTWPSTEDWRGSLSARLYAMAIRMLCRGEPDALRPEQVVDLAPARRLKHRRGSPGGLGHDGGTR